MIYTHAHMYKDYYMRNHYFSLGSPCGNRGPDVNRRREKPIREKTNERYFTVVFTWQLCGTCGPDGARVAKVVIDNTVLFVKII